MSTTAKTSPNTAALLVTLTPPQIRGLKLAKDGDLYLQASKKWTHRNARLPFAKADCFQERPIKIKFVTTATVGELRASGLLKTPRSRRRPRHRAARHHDGRKDVAAEA